MNKQMGKLRTIRFFSSKNQEVMVVHSGMTKKFAEYLENNESVLKYRTNVVLENWKQYISTVGIRSSYLSCEWTSDFVIENGDSQVTVCEIITKPDLEKQAEIEKLEISRRYWKHLNVSEWKVVLLGE